jgi:carboxymethylenebutenolidase
VAAEVTTTKRSIVSVAPEGPEGPSGVLSPLCTIDSVHLCRALSKRRAAAGPPFLLALLVSGCLAASADAFPHYGAGCSRADFTSGGTTVKAELCRSRASGGRAVVVLHGCGGFSTFDHRLVTELPRYGISTLAVDFFGPTPPPGNKGFCGGGDRSAGGDPFPVWIQVTKDAAAALRATKGINQDGVGVVGWSLGGGVAIAAAQGPKAQRPFDAVAGFSTGSFGDRGVGKVELPPTVLLSGGKTDAIPLAETLPLYRALRAAHIPSALYVYRRGSHNWPGEQGTLGIEHAASFLRRYLR